MPDSTEILFQAIANLMQQENKQFLAGQLATRLASVEDDMRFRYDPVARNIYAQINKLAQSDPNAIVSGDQISRYYNEIESLNPNTSFKEAYSDLFPASLATAPASASAAPSSAELSRHNYNAEPGTPGAAALEVSEDQELEPYTAPEFNIAAQFKPELHRFAELAISHHLAELGANRIRLAHKTNGPDLMIYQASFVTPTGAHNVVVPVQVQNDLVQLPEVFGQQDRAYPLTTAGFAAFESDNAKLVKIKAMAAADQLRHAESTDVSRNPSALDTYMNTETEVMEDDDLNLFKKQEHEGIKDIEAVLANAVLRKQSSFSPSVLNRATEAVSRELRTAGQAASPVFAGDGKNGDVLFTAKIQKNHKVANVTIPVETRGEQVLLPSVFTLGENSYELSERGITAAFEQNTEQARFDIETTDLATANYKTLRQVVYASAMKKDSKGAELALEVIASKYGQEAVASTMNDYAQWLRTAATAPGQALAQEFGHRMSQDDWAASLQAEIKKVTGSNSIALSPELDTLRFEKYDDPGFEGVITTNKISHIELT